MFPTIFKNVFSNREKHSHSNHQDFILPSRNRKVSDQFDFTLLESSGKNKLRTSKKNFLNTKTFTPNKTIKKISFNSTLSSSNLTNSTNTKTSTSNFNASANELELAKEPRSSGTEIKIIGLENIGNSCYMNSILQILFHSDPFMKEMLELQSPQGKLTKAFINLYNLIKNYNSNQPISPTEIKNTFAEYNCEYDNTDQHDAMEFCRIFLDTISQENNLNEVNSQDSEETSNSDFIISRTKTKKELSLEFDLFCRKKENSFILDLFYPQVFNIFKCYCNYKEYSFEKLCDIPLIVPAEKEKRKVVTLNEMLNDFFSEEKTQFLTRCGNCGKKDPHIKQSFVSKLPKILIFSLQRFNQYKTKKNNSVIEFTEEISMRKYIAKGMFDDNISVDYSLTGICHHEGVFYDQGHYFTECKIKNDWYFFNDSNVTKKPIAYQSSTVYCLFYTRKNKS